jgi:TetR/AcrR family transcriptional regulator, regulator of cefoperazone and chloramphenicol sensitivity
MAKDNKIGPTNGRHGMAGDNTKARILETAGEVFAEKGYEAATVREICERAGVNVAAVNYYFGGKASLYVQTLERAHACHQEQEDWPPGTPPAVKLERFIHRVLTHMLVLKDEPWQLRLMTREIISPTPAGKRLLCDHFRQGFQQLQNILDEILPPEMPDYQRHQIGLSIMGQCALYRGLGKIIPLVIGQDELKQHYSVDQLTEHIAHVSLAALGLAPLLTRPAREEFTRIQQSHVVRVAGG